MSAGTLLWLGVLLLSAACATGPTQRDAWMARSRAYDADIRALNAAIDAFLLEHAVLSAHPAFGSTSRKLREAAAYIAVDGPASAERHTRVVLEPMTLDEVRLAAHLVEMSARVQTLRATATRLDRAWADLHREYEEIMRAAARRQAVANALLLWSAQRPRMVNCTTSTVGAFAYTNCW